MLNKTYFEKLTPKNLEYNSIKELLNQIKDYKIAPLFQSHQQQKSKLNKFFEQLSTSKPVKIVCIPSISLPKEILENIVGITHYESRSLWETLRISNDQRLLSVNKNIEILFVTSVPVNNDYINHLFSSSGNPINIRKKVSFLSLNDPDTSKTLTQKILNDSTIISKINDFVNEGNPIIHPFMTSQDEETLANKLNLPYWGIHPSLSYFQTKSGNKKVISDANVPQTKGLANIKSIDQLLISIEKLWEENPSCQKFMLKLDQGVSGDGNAILKHKISFEKFDSMNLIGKREYLISSFENMKFQSKKMNWDKYLDRIKNGSIVEEFIDNEVYSSPSCQACILPSGKIEIYSTHEQILDKNGQTFLGCKFPAMNVYRQKLHEYTFKVGKQLQKNGVLGPYSVDFLVTKNNNQHNIYAIEINIRQGGTTHPLQTSKMLTQSYYNEDKGILISKITNKKIQYLSTDNILNKKLINKDPKVLIELIKKDGLLFDPRTNKGSVFHLFGAMAEFGKLGYITIGENTKDIQRDFCRVRAIINKFANNN
jgi:hypothetical protein